MNPKSILLGTVAYALLALFAQPRAVSQTPPTDATKSQAPAYEKHWYYGSNLTNDHPRLSESEKQIDRELNGPLGIIPGWQRPTTFKDWSDDFKLWSSTVGFGRDISPKTSWMFFAGAITGAIKNERSYWPLDTDIRFKRTAAYAMLTGYYYPLGKVESGRKKFHVNLRETKPYLGLGVGYAFVRAEGDVKLELPLLGEVLRQRTSIDNHMLEVAPRVGLQLPITANSSVITEVSYNQYLPHSSEFSGIGIHFGFRHKF